MRKSNLVSIIGAAPFMNAAASQTSEMLEDIHADFKNRYLGHICFADGGEGGEGGEGGQSGQGGSGGEGGQGGGFEFDYDKFAAAMIKAQGGGQGGQGGKGKGEEESAYDRQQRLQKEADEKKAANERLIADHDFNSNFDKFITDNGGIFGDQTPQSIKAQLEGIEGDKHTNALKALTVKHAFGKKELLDNLQPSDKAFIEGIMSKNETVIDGDKAWKLLQSALFVESKKERDQSLYKANDHSDAVRDTPNLVKFIDKLETAPKPGFQ